MREQKENANILQLRNHDVLPSYIQWVLVHINVFPTLCLAYVVALDNKKSSNDAPKKLLSMVKTVQTMSNKTKGTHIYNMSWIHLSGHYHNANRVGKLISNVQVQVTPFGAMVGLKW